MTWRESSSRESQRRVWVIEGYGGGGLSALCQSKVDFMCAWSALLRRDLWVSLVLLCVAAVSAGCVSGTGVEDASAVTRVSAQGPCDPERCAAHGECVRSEAGFCVPGSSDDCLLATVTCEQLGACAYWRGACRPAAGFDAQCNVARGGLGVNWCQVYGTCKARQGVCVALDDQDCAASSACKAKGLCAAEAGWCVARQ